MWLHASFLLCQNTSCVAGTLLESPGHLPFVQPFEASLVSRIQVFVVNPNKEPPILSLLCKNKHKLLAYLEDFQQDKGELMFTAALCINGVAV